MRTLLIVDDHDGYRTFVATLLDGGTFQVTGTAEDGATALEAVERLAPDLVLLDVQLPGMDGFEVAQLIAGVPGSPAVILTSTRDAQDFGSKLFEAPVIGFVPKHEMSEEALVEVVRAAGLGDALS